MIILTQFLLYLALNILNIIGNIDCLAKVLELN